LNLLLFISVSTAFVVFVAYLLGSIPFGLLIGLIWKRIDVRKHGSQNIGATNVARTVGKPAGALTLLLDAVKGTAAVLIAQQAGMSVDIQAAAALGAILGHVFPIYLKFKGGKGVAVGLGVFLALAPAPTVIAVASFGVVMAVTRIVSLSSMAGAVGLLAGTFVMGSEGPVIFLSALLFTLVVVRHRSNIVRILRKTEPTL
jgi:acyl phosphate:glycerol-3-phosphate acyltransferase